MSGNGITEEELRQQMEGWRKSHPELSEMYEKYKTFRDISEEHLNAKRPQKHISSVASISTSIS